ncbi:hypothetical protein [Rickettsiella endosymbiont of Aleochara curtula]|uniref:hypothetical protein n=1 Tax=Rickettsiella endosymbiont of Aleochara curtula TaxID=3077936 RepID=UPI00313C0A09
MNLMPGIVSSIKEHITTTEFWRALSFVLKRLESIAKYLTKLPLPFTFSLYILHLIRAALRIFSYFYKTKNKNLGDTCKLLFAIFKVSIAVIAIVLLGCGLATLPTILLSSFFAYSILKLIHSSIVLLVSTIYYLKIDKYCIEQQWRRAQYRDNISKHICMLGAGVLFVLLTCMLNAGASILILTNPLLLLADGLMCVAFIAAAVYLSYKIAKNKRTVGESAWLKNYQIAKIKKFLWMFGLGIVALLVTVAAPSLGVAAITFALVLLCAQDAILTIYYYFYSVYIPNPEPVNLSEAQLNANLGRNSRDYYQTFSPVLYLQKEVSEKLPHAEAVNEANKKLLLKAAFVKLLQLENKLEKISKLGATRRFFSPQKKLTIKKEYLLEELAWALNTNNKEALIDLFIQAIIDLPVNKRAAILEDNLFELLELFDVLGIAAELNGIDYQHPQRDKNFLAQLFFMAKRRKLLEQQEVVKPKLFYQSFWKKVGACEALSQAFKESRNIEEQLKFS